MGLFEFFFPDIAQATHLKDIAQSQRLSSARATHKRGDIGNDVSGLNREIDTLRSELGEAALVIEALIEKLESAEIVSRDELAVMAREIDARDGTVDGMITPESQQKKQPFLPKRTWPGGRKKG